MNRLMFLFKSYPLAILGIIILILWIVAAIVGPAFTGFTYSQLDIDHQMVRPGEGGHLLGTDALGRDILARILTGSRSILTVALLTSLCSTLAGVIVGFTAGYFGGKVDAVFLRIMDILMAIPPLVLAMVILG
ncbi:MAG: ABC transporter permease subunit, partial [Spirochaetaceae bacterium]|nr:ABC transporter permease subunit [Spirochaetaceae bacterium]